MNKEMNKKRFISCGTAGSRFFTREETCIRWRSLTPEIMIAQSILFLLVTFFFSLSFLSFFPPTLFGKV